MSEQSVVESGTAIAEETAIDVTSLSNEDLKTRLDAARTGETAETVDAPPVAKEPETAVEAKPDGQELPVETPDAQPTLESLQAEIEKTRALYKTAEEFNQQLKKEHAQYRQFVDAEIQRRKAEGTVDPGFDFGTAWAQDPKTAVELAARQIIESDRQAAQLRDMELSRYESDNKQYLTGMVGDVSTIIDDIAALVKSDGADDEYVSDLRKSPYRTDSALLLNLAQRAKLTKENATLKAELEKAKSELTTKAADVAKAISEAANKGPVVKGASGGAGASKGFNLDDGMTEEQIAQLSDADRAKLLAQLRGKG